MCQVHANYDCTVQFKDFSEESIIGTYYGHLDWLQSLEQFFINVSYYILKASLTLMALFKTEPSELDWLQVYDMTHR